MSELSKTARKVAFRSANDALWRDIRYGELQDNPRIVQLQQLMENLADLIDALERRMLDRGNLHPVPIAKRRAERRINDVAPACRDLGATLVAPPKHDTRTRRRRMQRQIDLRPAMQPNAAAVN